MKKKSVFLILLGLSISIILKGQNFDPFLQKDIIHKNIKQNLTPSNPKKSLENNFRILGTQIDRVQFQCQKKFLLGTNVAWNKYSLDLSNSNYDGTYFETMFTEVESKGGNSMRFWLHTNGVENPLFEDVSDPNKCTGISSEDTTNLKDFLNRAWSHGIRVQLCLWTHNMLSQANQYNLTQAVRDRNRKILEDPIYLQYYIDNALIKYVNAVKNHPGLLAWEIFNEAEGIATNIPHRLSRTPWANFEYTDYSNVLRTVNQMTGAIRRADPNALITTGALDFDFCSNVDGHVNYYHDDTLFAYGGDTDGYLDFYTVHYYDWGGTEHSPFDKPVSYWNLDKPLVLAEFYAEDTYGVPQDSLFEFLYDLGYAGAWGWCYNSSLSQAYWDKMKTGIEICWNNHSSEIDWDVINCDDLNALFEVDEIAACSGMELTFTDYSSNSPDTWNWDFGADATPMTATGKGPHKVSFSSTGNKSVTLTVKKGSLSSTLTKPNSVYLSQGHSITLLASDLFDCSGAQIDFTTTISPTLSSSANIDAVTTGPFSGGNIFSKYNLNSDGSVSPALSNFSKYLHGNWKAADGNEIEFTGNFGSGATAAIYSKNVGQSSENCEIFIDGISQGTKTFTRGVPDNFTVSVSEGTHTIKFKGGLKDWIEVEKYSFTNLTEKVVYSWYLNNALIPGEVNSNFSSTSLNNNDEIFVVASHSGFACDNPSIKSELASMNCTVTSNKILEVHDNIVVYPNPVVDQLNFNKIYSFSMYDSQGKLIKQGKDSWVDLTELKQGIYFLEIESKVIKIIHFN